MGVVAHRAGDDGAGVDAHSHGQTGVPTRLNLTVGCLNRLYDLKPGVHGPHGIVFVRGGEAEVDQQTVAEVLRDVAVVLADHVARDALVVNDNLAKLFGIQTPGEGSGVHEVAEQHGDVAAFCGGCGGCCGLRFGWIGRRGVCVEVRATVAAEGEAGGIFETARRAASG